MDKVHTIHHIGQELPDGLTWSGERLTKKRTTSRPDQSWPETWKDMSEASQQKKWAIEKPKLGSARRLRGIYFIDPAGANFKETIRNAWKKLEVPMPAAMPCKIRGRTYKELVANLDAPRRNTHAPLTPTNVPESVWKELYTKIMKPAFKRKNHFSKPLQSCVQIHSDA